MTNNENKTTHPPLQEWEDVFALEYQQDYFKILKSFLEEEIKQNKTFYPEPKNILRAFDLCPLRHTKVVIVGQDPYHGPGQAHGLSFSVPQGIKTPPSLQNIYKEIHQDLNLPIPHHGNLESWAEQGVLMLNATLTVQKSTPTSHSKKGWETFTDNIIQYLNDNTEGLVFMLWGRYAQNKGSIIDTTKHCVLKAAHPSPFSAHSGFFGCQHFSKANEYLEKQGKTSINWEVR